ncbi:unnamed protein product [Orchesella dallaii]|uniref:Syndecan n=1 Tax=Orchesella dallaii TaxID=48710 RepID=A0ABP1PQ73_9HEXA
MAPTTRLLYFLLVTLLCLAHSARGVGDDLSSKIDADLFLEDEGSGHGGGIDDDLEISGSGNGEDDEDFKTKKPVAKPTPKPEDPYGGGGGGGEPGIKEATDDPPHTGNEPGIFNQKNEPPASFFAQPGILAAIICGAIVGLLCAILLVMFIVYRMRKKDEGSYVLDDSKRTPSTYGKSKEFFA